MPRHPSHILEFAKRGAEARLRDLVFEVQNLIGLFPHLRESFDKDELPVRFILKEGADRAAKPQASQRRRKMSAASRKAIGERMRKYWEARRKAKKTS